MAAKQWIDILESNDHVKKKKQVKMFTITKCVLADYLVVDPCSSVTVVQLLWKKNVLKWVESKS